MNVSRLSLTNFRNYTRLELPLPPGSLLLHGDNAQGKTNLLEALYFLATTRSPHTSQDQQLINWDALQSEEPLVVGRLVADVVKPDGDTQLEMRLILENRRADGQRNLRREALINRRKVRLMDLLGQLRVVLFLPEDVGLLTGSPADRRRYMNITLCQVDPVYCRTLSKYNKILEQRNALLRRMGEGLISPREGEDLLAILTEKLLEPATTILETRGRFSVAMAREAQRIYYEDLIAERETVRFCYLPQWRSNGRVSHKFRMEDGEWLRDHQDNHDAVAGRLFEVFEQAKSADRARGSTTIGPHRDDWCMLVNGKNLGQFGSRGQLRTAVLALKLAEIQWMKAETSDVPVLLLDEVIAELDRHRSKALLEYVAAQIDTGGTTQALLTATDPGMFPKSFLKTTTGLTVASGRIVQDL